MIWDYWDDIEVGKKVISRGRTVTETDVVTFGMITGNWISPHFDVEYAKTTPYGKRLVQGTLIFSWGPGLLPIGPPGLVVAFFGVDKIRFVKPVFIGDTIYVEHEIIGKEDRKDYAGLVSIRLTFKNQRNEVVQINEERLLVAKKCMEGAK